MHCSTTNRRAATDHHESAIHLRCALVRLALATTILVFATIDVRAQGRTITQFPYTQAFGFIPTGTSTTPSGPIGATIFPTSDVDGGEFTVDTTTSAMMVSGSTTGLNNNVGAGGVIRIQTSGSALPTTAQGFIVHASFTSRIAGSISIDWSKVNNGTSTRTNELRIAVSADNAPFSEIAAATFDNSTTAQSGALSTSLSTTLNGAASVRFRIYSINLSGSGGHPRVVVDNLRITADAETPLPVELAGFEANYHDGLVGLQWQTASEHENEGFEVLRAIAPDSLFAPIASFRSDEALRGMGTSPTGRSYRYEDELPPSVLASGPTLLYRLADIATDGSRTEHPIRAVRIESETVRAPEQSLVRFRLAAPIPMPGAEQLVARLKLAGDEMITMEIVDPSGSRHLRTAAEPLGPGSHELRLDIGGLPSGIYVLVARAGDLSRTQRFVILR